MLMVALIAIGLSIALPELAFQVKREREGEMIHRGVQYARAIKRYYKKFGRYPTKVEDLEGTNNVRFLRRRYKDPITGKDFRLLHFGQVPMGMGGVGLAGAMAAAGGLGGRGPGAANMMGTLQAQAGMAAMASGVAAMQSTTTSPFANASQGNSEDASNGTTGPGIGGGTGGSSSQPTGASGGTGLSGQTFGGGPVIGVVSMSKAQSIREFASKNHYSDWNFVYDPSMDRGGLITGPAEPLKGLGAGQQPGMTGGVPGATGQTGFGQSGFGQSGFGQNGLNQQQQQPQPPPQAAPEQQ